LIEGNGDLLADAWYDDNLAIKTMFQHGYRPIIKPNQSRSGGYWRRKARKLYSHPTGKQKYRQRGRGESPFGSLTVELIEYDRMGFIPSREVRSLECCWLMFR